MRFFVFYVIGLTFGVGIALSGMMNPAKVVNFFDVAGSWDPSLAFVMGGAVTVAFIGYRLVLRRPAPTGGAEFKLPTSTAIDKKLIAGSAIFGVGWGIAGFCPGAALPAIGTGRVDVVAFVAALVAGISATRYITYRQTRIAPAHKS